MSILVHVCCGPCLVYPARVLNSDHTEFAGFFYNPNIHPYKEFRRRLDSAKLLAEQENIEIFYFSSFDEAWKISDEGEVGAYWGQHLPLKPIPLARAQAAEGRVVDRQGKPGKFTRGDVGQQTASIYRAPRTPGRLDQLPPQRVELLDHGRYMLHAVQSARVFGRIHCAM